MISVIIRTKDEVGWLERCLRAVRLQSLPVEQIIVVDNVSTDGTRDHPGRGRHPKREIETPPQFPAVNYIWL